MRRLLLAAIAAACVALPASSKADSEANNGSEWVRITALPCSDEKVLQHIPEAERKDWRAAMSKINGVAYAACWKPLFQLQNVQMKYEDGDDGFVPFAHLKPVKSV
jgi:hypothetical protein